VLIDTRVAPELAREGMARDVVRQVQELRKNAGLQMEDRIVIYLGTAGAELQKAIDAHRDAIGAETLTVQWAEAAPNGEAHRETVKIEGQALEIALTKA
jgi:isoleucyl-tRNA synthetase